METEEGSVSLNMWLIKAKGGPTEHWAPSAELNFLSISYESSHVVPSMRST